MSVRLLPLLLFTLLAGCGGELATPGEALRVFGDSLPQAYLGEPYNAPIRAIGGLRPFDFRIDDGELPEGIALQGGQLRGTPTEEGLFEFTVAVSDANLSEALQEYTLRVVRRPPPRLTLVAPSTEVRGETAIRVSVTGASALRGVSALVTWDAAQFELVAGSARPSGGEAALLADAGRGRLQLDLAALGGTWNGDVTIATFALVPLSPVVPELEVTALLIDDRGNRHFQQAAEPPLDATTAPGEGEAPAAGGGEGGADDAQGNDPSASDDAVLPDEEDAPLGDEAGDAGEVDDLPRDEPEVEEP